MTASLPASIGSPAAWAIFSAVVLLILVVDLGVVQRRPHDASLREALLVTLGLVLLASLFALGLYACFGREIALQFVTGYVIEEALSVDNLFVFLLIFNHFRIPTLLQHRVLFWGIFGALTMRALFIAVGTTLVSMFHWVFYLFGAFLLFTGVKIMFQKESDVEPENSLPVRLYKRLVPTSSELVGAAFFTRENGKLVATPLLLVLFVVEITDLVFAVDSIPAILAVTTDPFLVYTSNVFAILGLRSLFFVLASMMNRFHLLKYGLGIVLMFIGAKMLVDDFYKVSTGLSLAVIALVLGISVVASALSPDKKNAENQRPS